MSSTLTARFADYGAHHQDRWNKLSHCVGIPVIALAGFGLGSKVTLLTLPGGLALDLGVAVMAALVLVYLRWHVGLALGIGVLFVPLYLVGSLLPALWLWAILALGVALQYLGHYAFERRAPAFHKNLVHTLVGPLWVAALLFEALGWYRPGR